MKPNKEATLASALIPYALIVVLICIWQFIPSDPVPADTPVIKEHAGVGEFLEILDAMGYDDVIADVAPGGRGHIRVTVNHLWARVPHGSRADYLQGFRAAWARSTGDPVRDTRVTVRDEAGRRIE